MLQNQITKKENIMPTYTLSEFANILVEQKQTSYYTEKNYVNSEVKKQFNKLINFSARYVEGRKVIPYSNLLNSNLKLGFRYSKWINYDVAFSRFLNKLKDEKFAQRVGLYCLNYNH
jgi:hypothetical protein